MIDTHKGVIRFNREIDGESASWILSEIENKLKDYQDIIIYFTSEGGSVPDAKIIVDYINQYPNRIAIVGTWSIWSSMFDIFLLYVGEKRLLPPVHGLVHLSTNTFDLVSTMKKKSFDSFNLENIKKENDKYLERLRHVLTEDEYTRVAAGEDVYLDESRLIAIFGINKKVDKASDVSHPQDVWDWKKYPGYYWRAQDADGVLFYYKEKPVSRAIGHWSSPNIYKVAGKKPLLKHWTDTLEERPKYICGEYI